MSTGNNRQATIKLNSREYKYQESQDEWEESIQQWKDIIVQSNKDSLEDTITDLKLLHPSMLRNMAADAKMMERISKIKTIYADYSQKLSDVFSNIPPDEDVTLVKFKEMLEEAGAFMHDVIILAATNICKLFNVAKENIGSVIRWLMYVLKENEEKVLQIVKTHAPHFIMLFPAFGMNPGGPIGQGLQTIAGDAVALGFVLEIVKFCCALVCPAAAGPCGLTAN